MTWKEMEKKYPGYREDMDKETEQAFVADCFDCYESEGFAKKFWSPFGHCPEHEGEPFTVLGRLTEAANDLETLPMWRIRFLDDTETDAYPEEVISREMRDNGCKLEEV